MKDRLNSLAWFYTHCRIIFLHAGLSFFYPRNLPLKFGQNLDKIEILTFLKNTQNCFAYISVIKYRSEAVLYSKRSAGYSLSPHIKTIVVAFLQAE